MPQKHQCKDCGKIIWRYRSMRCRDCYKLWLKNNLPKTVFKKGDLVGKKHPRWTGGKSLWAKRVVIKRDKICQHCGLDEISIMDIAHLKGHEIKGKNRRYINHNPKHLILLCPNCHRRYDLRKKLQ